MITNASTLDSKNPKSAHLTTLFIREAPILAKIKQWLYKKSAKLVIIESSNFLPVSVTRVGSDNNYYHKYGRSCYSLFFTLLYSLFTSFYFQIELAQSETQFSVPVQSPR